MEFTSDGDTHVWNAVLVLSALGVSTCALLCSKCVHLQVCVYICVTCVCLYLCHVCVFVGLCVRVSPSVWNDQAGLLWLPQMSNTWIVMIPSSCTIL